MKKKYRIIAVVVLLALFSATGYAVIRLASVEKQVGATWISNPELPNGGVIVSRGEGASGVITVNIPPMTQIPEEPVQLTWENVTGLDITVENENGVSMHFGNKSIRYSAYLIEFTHDWGNDIVVRYVLRNNYEGDGK